MTLSSEEIKSVALAIVDLCLSEGISQSVSQSVRPSVSQSVKKFHRISNFLIILLEGFVVYLRTFLGLAMLNQDITKWWGIFHGTEQNGTEQK